MLKMGKPNGDEELILKKWSVIHSYSDSRYAMQVLSHLILTS